MPRGGARPGSGNKKGVKLGPQKATLSKEAAREALRQIVLKHMDEMVAAQVAASKGLNHFMLRDPKSGQFKRITDPDEIAAALNAEGAEEGKTFWIWAKDPSVQAFTDLMNRALDKPKEQEQEVKHSGGLVIQHETID